MKVIFLGAPGAGKGTQAQILASKLGIPKLTTSDMLREVVKSGSEIGKEAASIMDAGNLIPDHIMIEILAERLRRDDCKNGFILDGFPRTIPQAIALDKLLGEDEIESILTFFLEVKEEESIERLSGRYTCAVCGASYHETNNPPSLNGVCNICGGTEFVHRKDDDKDLVRKRLRVYNEQTMPLIEYYERKNRLKRIDGAQSIDVITRSIEEAL